MASAFGPSQIHSLVEWRQEWPAQELQEVNGLQIIINKLWSRRTGVRGRTAQADEGNVGTLPDAVPPADPLQPVTLGIPCMYLQYV